ncbi:hypothetical protein [Actinoplanes solisilvae]|uniref:hypothetical protein n=1 Tax=Actinoplanes solisilvae TaxID=2486853 RepID=UPI000FDC02A0|nr:hypothetical protein [Actinoplanes solisilvae]
MDNIDSVLAEASRAWRAAGVAAPDRARLAADLRLDLESAAADGVDPARLIEGDVAAFARALADEAGVRSGAAQHSRFLVTSLLGGLVAGVASSGLVIAVFALCVRLFDLSVNIPVHVVATVVYSLPAVAFVAGAVVAVRLRLRDVHRAAETARVMMLLLPLTAVVITLVTVAFARSTGYSVDPVVVLTEAALVLAALAAAIVASRKIALRAGATRPEVRTAS